MLSSDKSCTRQAKPAPSQHPSYPLTSWSITLGVPPPTIPPPKLACLTQLHPPTHLPLLITLPHFPAPCAALPRSHPSALDFLRPLLPRNLPHSLSPLSPSPFPFFKCLSRRLHSSHPGSRGRDRELSPPGSLTLVRGTNCPLLLAYTAGKLRTCGGEKVQCVHACVHVCVL